MHDPAGEDVAVTRDERKAGVLASQPCRLAKVVHEHPPVKQVVQYGL